MSAEAVNLVRFHDFEASPPGPGRRYGSSAAVKHAVMLELAWRWWDIPIPVSVRELAERLHMHTSTVGLALAALEADGYITRTPRNGSAVARISLICARVTRAACAGDTRTTARVTRALRPQLNRNWKSDDTRARPGQIPAPGSADLWEFLDDGTVRPAISYRDGNGSAPEARK